jgi:hypothetical protein
MFSNTRWYIILFVHKTMPASFKVLRARLTYPIGYCYKVCKLLAFRCLPRSWLDLYQGLASWSFGRRFGRCWYMFAVLLVPFLAPMSAFWSWMNAPRKEKVYVNKDPWHY